MSLTIPTEFPATIELPEGFLLKFKQSPVRPEAREASLLERDYEIWFECGYSAAESLLALLACLDEDTRLPDTVALALRDLSHQAVDMVCERLSNEPLSSAVFAEDFAAAPVATEGKTPRSMENVLR